MPQRPCPTRVERYPSCSVSVYSRDAMVASGVRPWGEMSCCARARSALFVAQRLAGLVQDVVGGVEVGGHSILPCRMPQRRLVQLVA
jgi:hypothetical protein